MKALKLTFLFVLLASMALPVGLASAQDEDCSGIAFINARARASVAPNSAAYGYVVNLTNEDVVLTGGASDVSEVIEIHDMVMEDDVMVMTPLADGLTIPAGGSVILQPGGLHVMMIGLDGELAVGDAFDLTLNFEGAGELALTVPVQDISGMMDMDMDMDDMDMESEDGDMDMESEDGDMDDMSDDMDMMSDTYSLSTIGFEGCDSVVLGDFHADPSDGEVSGAYGYVLNFSDEADMLMGFSTPIASDPQILEVMTSVEGVEVAANSAFVFSHGDWYLWLGDLTQELVDGDSFDLTLSFANAGDVTTSVAVRTPGMMMMDMDMDMDGDMDDMDDMDMESEDGDMDMDDEGEMDMDDSEESSDG